MITSPLRVAEGKVIKQEIDQPITKMEPEALALIKEQMPPCNRE